MNINYSIDKKIGVLLAQNQDASPISVETAALDLGCSPNTLRNWFRGKSAPTPAEFFAYCSEIDVDGLNLLTQALYKQPEHTHNMELHALIDCMDPDDQDRLLHLLKTYHGSDPKAMLQQMTAQSHLPMIDRVLAAKSVETSYRISERQGTLVDPDAVEPDMEYLHDAIQKGENAAYKGLNNYVQSQGGTKIVQDEKSILNR